MQTQTYNSIQFSTLLPTDVIAGGDYAFPMPGWLVGVLTTPSTDEISRVKPFELRLTFAEALEAEFAVWDQLSDEALLSFEAELE